jgi:hypothetical protein
MKVKYWVTMAIMFAFVFTSIGLTPAAGIQVDWGEDSAAHSGWPVPKKPVPYHKPGRLSSANQYTSQVDLMGENGLRENTTLTGIDAMVADGLDPLAGNYTLVGWDQLLRSDPNGFLTYSIDTELNTIQYVDGSHRVVGNRSMDIASGDLNNDGKAEQIAAWMNASNQIQLLTGEMPGSLGKTTSAPAAVVAAGSINVLVRGYDQVLWRCSYSGSGMSFELCENEGSGGVLLSAPVVVPLSSGFEVYAILLDNLVYRRTWDVSWSSSWELVDVQGYWQPLDRWDPFMELTPPAVVRRDTKVDLFRIGPDNTLHWRHYNGTSWAAWQNLGGMLASGPAAIPLTPDSLQVFARGADEALWTRVYSNGWGAWKRVKLIGMAEGVTIASTPAVISPSTEKIDVYVRGSDDHLWKVHYNGSAWGAWSGGGDEDGQLASAVGGALFGGQIYLFAQTHKGELQVKAPEADLVAFPGGLPACCNITNTGLTGIRREFWEYQDYSVNVETGRFLGDGRSQIVLGYLSPNARTLNLVLYDISTNREAKGFTPVKVNQGNFSITTTGDILAFRFTTGNFLGGDIDDIALVYQIGTGQHVRIISFDRATKQLSIAKQLDHGKPGTSEHWNGTLEIVSGDFDGNGQANFAINTTFFKSGGAFGNDYYYFRTHIHNVDKEGKLNWYYNEIYSTVDVYNYQVNRHTVAIVLAAGDVNGDGRDEIIRTWPTGFSNNYNDTFKRLGQVISWKAWKNGVDGFSVENFVDGEQGGTSRSYGDRLVVGDFDRDLVGEIYWMVGDGRTTPLMRQDVYKYNPVTKKYNRIIAKNDTFVGLSRLAAADFSRKGLLVGPPSYRMQSNMTSPLVLLNLPPMHQDIVNGQVVSTNLSASAVHKTGTSQDDRSKTESKRDWALSAGLEIGVGAAGHKVTASLENTYGENFSKAASEITSRELALTTTAQYYDQVLFNGTDYGIWEYPVYGAPENEGEGAKTISVIFPLVSSTTLPRTMSGQWCDENFYAASHQPYNIWSYGAIGSPQFDDFGKPIADQQSTGGTVMTLLMRDVLEEERTNSFHNQISAGVEYTYENELSVPLVGKAYDVSFRASVNGSYSHENIRTLGSTYVEETEVTVSLPGDPIGASYQVRSYLYWAAGGYMVVDYRTMPDPLAGTIWPLYTKSDPAFILPWYGFPDPANPIQPPCGADRQLFTHDIKIKPAYVQNGETTTVTATVRNFSNVIPTGTVIVRFYHGVPAGSNSIGQCTIAGSSLARINGPQNCSIDWVVAGAYGTEKIYAVIDPEGHITEMHDENDPYINNNTGYGLLYAAQADYLDPGLSANHQMYQALVHQNAPGLGFSLHLPTNNQVKNIRYEILPIPGALSGVVGTAVNVSAFQGGSDVPDENHVFGAIPAVLMASYRDSDLGGISEENLKIYRLDGQQWVDATCAGYQTVRFPEDNLIAVPVCKTGAFALAAAPPTAFKPSANFSASPLDGRSPLSIQFTDLSANDPNVWVWDFGDGIRGYDKNPVHTYRSSGVYTVTLTARNGFGGDTLTRTGYISVAPGGIYLPIITK